MSDDLRAVVAAAVADVNLQLPPERRLAGDDASPVLGAGTTLDSLATLNLLVGVEERCAELGLDVALLDEALLADAAGPLATLGSLVAHLAAVRAAQG
jgi:hypothetical protein